MTHRHRLALGCLVVFCFNSIVVAGEPNGIFRTSFWMHSEYGVSHAQHQEVPFLCLWDTYCQRHSETSPEICQHQYLVDAGRHGCHSCRGHRVARLCGNPRHSGHCTTLTPARELALEQDVTPLAEATAPSHTDAQTPEHVTTDEGDASSSAATEGKASNSEQTLPPNDLPTNAIPGTTRSKPRAKLPNWVSWLTD